MPPYQYPDQWESAGFNTAGVGMSATESIFSSKKALTAEVAQFFSFLLAKFSEDF